MILCSHHHLEVCYEDHSTCPVCSAIAERDEVQNKLDEQIKENRQLTIANDSLNEQYDKLTASIA